MIYNKNMEQILSNIISDDIPPRMDYPIWEKTNLAGQPFWGVRDFCGVDKSPVEATIDLTDLEWDGNEVRLVHTIDIGELVKYGLGIIVSWKKQMEREYSQIPFDILLSIDDGDGNVSPSVTLRFWALRNQYHYVDPLSTELLKLAQPVLMEQVNYSL